MPRRRVIAKRELLPDPLYNSQLVTRFINCLMKQGKKCVAEQILYDAMNWVAAKRPGRSVKVFQKAIENVKPALEVKSRASAGRRTRFRSRCGPNRRTALAIRWLIPFATRAARDHAEKLADEFVDASKGEGGAVRKREDVHRMAEANKAFAHYRF